MTKREARKYVYAIMALGEITSTIDAQVCCDANHNFAKMPVDDKKLIMQVAEEFEQELFNKAGDDVTAFVGRMP